MSAKIWSEMDNKKNLVYTTPHIWNTIIETLQKLGIEVVHSETTELRELKRSLRAREEEADKIRQRIEKLTR